MSRNPLCRCDLCDAMVDTLYPYKFDSRYRYCLDCLSGIQESSGIDPAVYELVDGVLVPINEPSEWEVDFD